MDRIVDFRWLKRGGKFVEQSLVRWKRLPLEDATWEDSEFLAKQFPHLTLKDKGPLRGGGIDTPRRSSKVPRPSNKYVGKQANGDMYLWARIRNASDMQVETTELDDKIFICIYSMRGRNDTTCAMILIHQHSPQLEKWKRPPGQNPSIINIAGTYQMDATFLNFGSQEMYKLFDFIENTPLAFEHPLDFVRWMVEFVKTLAGHHLG
ncbi:hypothetical protein WN944_000775 [Citrus x changshan-huyou]|uniref:Chromo domain-containing protein n=1 Tax=Citrus x changshan-huyou TaxID=2935761 RepID=A0AAP0QQL1_9ROSI